MRPLLFIAIVFWAISSCSDIMPVEVVEETYEDGSPKLIRIYEDTIDSVVLKEIWYYPNGNKRMEGEFMEEERHGKWTYWYENGNKWSEGYFYMGKSDSIRTTYYESGGIYYEGHFDNGKRTGEWKFYSEEGKLEKTIDYSDK